MDTKYIILDGELRHYGIPGMKWGKRKAYGSMPKMATKKRQIEADKKVLNKMNNSDYHVSVGVTKKRQAALDKRDKSILEKRIEKNTKGKTKDSKSSKRIEKGLETTAKLIATLMAADKYNKNQKQADDYRKKGSGTSAAITEFANDVSYKSKVNKIWD